VNGHHLDPSTLARILGGDHNGNNITAPGPNNIDRRNDRSMSITLDPDAPEGFVVYSHSAKNTDMECRDYVRRTCGLPEWKPAPREPEKPKPRPTVICHYVYEDQNGEPYLRVTRKSDKTFAQSHWDIDGWQNGKPSGPVIPYRLPDILANADQTIHLVEGEKSADYLRSLGLIATTAPGGGSAFPLTDDFAVWFDGQRVRAYPDNDATGRKWAERVSQRLPHAEIVWLPDQPEKAGADDWLTRGGRTIDDLINAKGVVPSDTLTDDTETPDTDSTPARIVATPFDWIDPLNIAPRAWLYGDHLIRRFVSLTVSPGGIGKSSLVMMEALCMTSGKSLLTDDKVRTDEPLRVWYWNGEDPQDETQRRVIAAAIHHGLTAADIGGRLFTDTGREQTITLGQITRGEITLQESLFDELEAEIIARQIDVFILDPFVSAHRMGENDNNAIDAVIKRLGKLAERANCAVEIVHHVRKPSGGNKDATDVNDARGASALVGGVRSARVLNVMSEDIAGAIDGFNIDDRFSYFSVSNGKANMTKRSGEGKWRHLHDFDLKNGPVGTSDRVGVVEYFKLPEKAAALDALPPNAVMIVQKAAYDYPNETRVDPQSPDWFGHTAGRFLGINSVDKSGKETLKLAIQAWIRSGALAVEIRPDSKRRPKEYLACPPSETPLSQHSEPSDDLPF
jgi:AAA domain